VTPRFDALRSVCGPALSLLQDALSCGYPGRGAELIQRVREEARKVEERLVSSCDVMERRCAFVAGLEPYQDAGELAAIRDAGALAPLTRQRLAAFAHALGVAPGEHDRGRKVELARDPAAARLICAGTARERGPMLTERAWAWILKEEDAAVLGLLLDLWSCEARSEETARVRRALLENRVLCVEVARMMGDEAHDLERRRP
jgi:hypothetical protein